MPMLCAEPLPRAVVQLVEDEPILRDSTGREGIVMYGRPPVLQEGVPT